MRSCLPFALLLVACTIASAEEAPPTVVWNGERLRDLKSSSAEADFPFARALQALRRQANRALGRGPYAVTDKSVSPPSGNKHDYISFGPYWWPNPETQSGLPYVRRDGERNPQSQTSDKTNLQKMVADVKTLVLAAYFFDDRRAADHAAKLLRTWFLDRRTRMNPHLEYGQAIPGINDGRGVGIIDTTELVELLDAVELLRFQRRLNRGEVEGLQEWFRDYLNWLRASDHGLDEARANNNHGSWYDVQCARFAIFVGQENLARQIVAEAASRRIEAQIEPDGRQPHELARTKSLSYSLFNLRALVELARLGDRLGVDLWQGEGSEGRLKKAIEFVAPYLADETSWPYPQIERANAKSSGLMLLLLAVDRFGDARCAELVEQYRREHPADRRFLLYP